MIKKTSQSVRNFYEVFTSGLTLNEIERLVSVDARDTYDYYAKHIKETDPRHNRFKRFLVICWRLFVAFLMRLTPARRLFYAIAVLCMFYSFYLYSFVIMTFLLALEVADKLITKDELQLARDIQMSLLPSTINPPAGYDIAAFSDVASSVGGDYYDLIPLGDGSSIVVIGDVSGKGISAALYMVKVQTALQLFARQSSDPRELLIRMNRYLYGQLKKNYFLTIALLQIYPDGGIRYCRAGHTPALFWENKNRTCTKLQPGGAALGLAPSDAEEAKNAGQNNGTNGHYYEQMIETHSSKLETGDVLFLFTDGAPETVNNFEQEFGENRILEIVSENSHVSAEGIKTSLINELVNFRNGTELRDDTTFVIIKRTT